VPLTDLLVPAPGAVHEAIVRYGAEYEASIYMERLKRRWRRSGAPHADMRLAIRVLFGDDTDAVLAWLEDP
jgi:hypothetical protein